MSLQGWQRAVRNLDPASGISIFSAHPEATSLLLFTNSEMGVIITPNLQGYGGSPVSYYIQKASRHSVKARLCSFYSVLIIRIQC